MQTAMHLEAFYVSWMSVSDKQDRQKGGQDLRRKADFEANNLVQVQYLAISTVLSALAIFFLPTLLCRTSYAISHLASIRPGRLITPLGNRSLVETISMNNRLNWATPHGYI
jgi:hypothetical protein